MINNYLERQIKENFPYQPTPEQEIAVKSLSEFLLSPRSEVVFMLRGYAGTGKTSLVGALVRTLDKLQQKSVLLAPTGRAAKVFSAYAGHPAFTIHKKIYRQQSFSNELSNFSVNDNLTTHTLYIVDEASMISNEGLSGSMFGTGRLLDDLVQFVYSGQGCRLLLMGDTAQLPPVGEEPDPGTIHQWGPWRSNGDGTHTRRCTASGCFDQQNGKCCGGTPNCTQRASCILCGAKYGKTDPTRHASLEKLEAIAATAAANGRVECWHCTACDKYFADASGKTELTAENTVTEKVPPSIIQGSDARWKKGESSTLTFRSDAAFEDFAEVLVDGAALPSESYEKRNGEGNIIVELRESYLEQLAEGEHTLAIRSARGDATTHFTVEAAPDETHPVSWWVYAAALGAFAIGTCVAVISFRRKKAG